MKPPRRKINIVKHVPTGAEVPIVIDKMNNNVIENYHEITDNRKGFGIEMLMDRWKMNKENVANLLQQYKIPAHVNHDDIKKLSNNSMPLDVAFFFEEYIHALEKKINLGHAKLKSKTLEDFRKSIRK